MTLSSMLIGSEPELAQQDFTLTINGNPDVMSLAAGPYYLHHDDSVISLVGALADLCSLHTVPAAVAIFITEGGYVRIEVGGVASFAITWGAATDLRDLLGFTGNLSGALAYTAQNPSPLIWIPQRTEISDARLGTLGDPIYDTAVGQPAGSTPPVATQHNVRYHNEFEWRHCLGSTVRTLSGSQNGKWWTFHERVVRRFNRLFLYREIPYVAASTAIMTINTSLPYALGPYVWRPPTGNVRYQVPREEEMREAYNRVTLPVTLVDEYDS